MRMLDNVIDINYYAVAKARNSNLKHRPVGLGIMGFQDCLHLTRTPYASEAALEFADRSMEAVCYHAYWASTELAEERGRYSSYKGSLWDRGILPQDSLKLLRDERGGYVDIDESSSHGLGRAARAHQRARDAQLELRRHRADRDDLQHHRRGGVDRARVPEHLRQVEPVGRVHRRQRAARARPEGARPVGRRDGRRPQVLRRLARQDRPRAGRDARALRHRVRSRHEWIVEAGARRQKWIDQAQSLNIYMAGASGKKLDETYKLAWVRGLKTTYYLRTLAATSAEKSTGTGRRAERGVGVGRTAGQRRAGRARRPRRSRGREPKFCPIDDPTCEACQ